jgi:hypothetical protein
MANPSTPDEKEVQDIRETEFPSRNARTKPPPTFGSLYIYFCYEIPRTKKTTPLKKEGDEGIVAHGLVPGEFPGKRTRGDEIVITS